MAKRWYVVQTNAKEEQTAFENLKNQRYNTFLPRIEMVYAVRGVNMTDLTPLFPTYLFVQFDIKRSKWRSILGTRGVRTLLGSTDIYASPLPRGFVEDLTRQADKRGCITLRRAEQVVGKHTIGERTRIKSGIYEGISGTCIKIQDDFASLLLALQSGHFEIKLPLSSIEFI